MTILLALIPISLALLVLMVLAFLWAVRSGQFDDLDTPPLDALADDSHPHRASQAPDLPAPDHPTDDAD